MTGAGERGGIVAVQVWVGAVGPDDTEVVAQVSVGVAALVCTAVAVEAGVGAVVLDGIAVAPGAAAELAGVEDDIAAAAGAAGPGAMSVLVRLRLGLWLGLWRGSELRLVGSRLRSWLRCGTSLGLLGTRLWCGTGFGLGRTGWLNLREVVGFGWTVSGLAGTVHFAGAGVWLTGLGWLNLRTFVGLAGARDLGGASAGLTRLNCRLAGPDKFAWAGGGFRGATVGFGRAMPGWAAMGRGAATMAGRPLLTL